MGAISPRILIKSYDCQSRLDRWLKKNYGHVSYGICQKLLRKGTIQVNQRKVPLGYCLKEGDDVFLPDIFFQLACKKEKKDVCLKEDIFLDKYLIYEDKNIILLNKPAGLAVQGGTKVKTSLDQLFSRWRPQEGIRLVHRLDKDTSGVLLLAKTHQSAVYLTGLFKKRQIEKIYHAYTLCNDQLPVCGEIKNGIPLQREERLSCSEEQLSCTEYSILEVFDNCMFVRLKPLTGRKHQLRIHCAQLDIPILGDRKYNRKTKHSSLYLHASVLDFTNQEGKRLRCYAAYPSHMIALNRKIQEVRNEVIFV